MLTPLALAAALKRIQRLQQQGGFANARVAADQHHAALDHAAAQHPVQVLMAGGGARHIDRIDLAQGGHFGGCSQRGKAVLDSQRAVGH
jgi:hypothetical protein